MLALEARCPGAERLLKFAGVVASLEALERGAPALAMLQLVLRMRSFKDGSSNLAMLWSALERLRRLSALTICWMFEDDWHDAGKPLTALLDEVAARLPGVTDLCLVTSDMEQPLLELEGPGQHQVVPRVRCNTRDRQCCTPDLVTAFQHKRCLPCVV